MDRLLRPAKLEADPNAPDSKQVFKHWRKTFERFVAATENGRDVNDPEIDKYGLLINYVSSSVYNYIEETNDKRQAITLLERAYIKPRNKIMARHLLSTRTQLTGERFLDDLRRLAKDCDFEAVDAQTHQQKMIRDAFIKNSKLTVSLRRIDFDL